MGKPGQRMVTDLAVVLGDIGPIAAFPDAEKHTAGSLMRAQGEYNLVPFSEAGIDRSDAGHIHEPLFVRLRSKLGLVREPGFLEAGFGLGAFTRQSGSLSLWSFLIVQALCLRRRRPGQCFESL